MGLWDREVIHERLDKAFERCTREGESPVVENRTWSICIPSSTEPEKFRVNQRGPPRKAKYYCVTDREIVPRGKGEKNPGEGSEIEHETVSLQAIRARFNV